MDAKATPTAKSNILLVDDRPEGLALLEAVLRQPAYNLVTAASGEEALKRLLDDDFAVILLDVQMPGLDGFDTAAIIKTRQKSRDIPIIFVTATNREDPHVVRGYETGAVDYIFKPFDPEILKSKVGVFVDIFKKNLEIKRQGELLRQSEQSQREQLLARLELESFQRYRDLAEAMPHMVWRAYADGAVDYVNRLWCEYTGLTLDQSTGLGWQGAVQPEDLRDLLALWEKAKAGEADGFESECRVRSKDGACRWHLLRAVAEKSRSGRLTSWIGTITDIHVRKEAENEMRKAQALKEEFLANITHEIRTPINGVMGMAALLADTALDAEQRGFVQAIQSSSATLLSLVNDVLDFSGIASGKVALETADFELRRAIDDPIGLLEPKAREKKLRLMSYVDPKLPALLRGDMRRLCQVLLNLAGNAIKFTDAGSVVVRALLEARGADGALVVRFAVTDTGIGIAEGERSRLFQPFSQADGSSTRRYGGTGLGLSICKDLVGLMGGEIGVDSRAGEGSVFWFTVPLKEAAGPAKDEGIKNLRVLVVDSDPEVTQAVKAHLDGWSIRSDGVRTSSEALASLRFGALVRDPYDIALINQAVTETDALAFARTICSDAALGETRLIMLTGRPGSPLAAEAQAAGFVGALAKPFEKSELLNCLVEASEEAPDAACS